MIHRFEIVRIIFFIHIIFWCERFNISFTSHSFTFIYSVYIILADKILSFYKNHFIPILHIIIPYIWSFNITWWTIWNMIYIIYIYMIYSPFLYGILSFIWPHLHPIEYILNIYLFILYLYLYKKIDDIYIYPLISSFGAVISSFMICKRCTFSYIYIQCKIYSSMYYQNW